MKIPFFQNKIGPNLNFYILFTNDSYNAKSTSTSLKNKIVSKGTIERGKSVLETFGKKKFNSWSA